jgi:hypothetical protein
MEKFDVLNAGYDYLGYVTSICILPADIRDIRMGHSDPHVLIGYSRGHILNFRIRAMVYTHKAGRIRKPVDLSRFVDYHECKRIFS